MAHSTEILKIAVSKKIKILEHPVKIKYHHNGQSIFESIIANYRLITYTFLFENEL